MKGSYSRKGGLALGFEPGSMPTLRILGLSHVRTGVSRGCSTCRGRRLLTRLLGGGEGTCLLFPGIPDSVVSLSLLPTSETRPQESTSATIRSQESWLMFAANDPP